MKSFTAKEFSRCPAKVYDAAKDVGSVEITHERFNGGRFCIAYIDDKEVNSFVDRMESNLARFEGAMLRHAESCMHDNGNGTFSLRRTSPFLKQSPYIKGDLFLSRGFICRVEEYSGGADSETPEGGNKVGDIAYIDGYRVILAEKAPD